MESLVNRGLGVEGESSIDLGGDLAGDDLQDLGAELNKEVVEGRFDLGSEITTFRLGLSDGFVDQGRVLGLLGGGEDERGVGGGILGLVLANGCNSRQYGKISMGRQSRYARLPVDCRSGIVGIKVVRETGGRGIKTDRQSHLGGKKNS